MLKLFNCLFFIIILFIVGCNEKPEPTVKVCKAIAVYPEEVGVIVSFECLDGKRMSGYIYPPEAIPEPGEIWEVRFQKEYNGRNYAYPIKKIKNKEW